MGIALFLVWRDFRPRRARAQHGLCRVARCPVFGGKVKSFDATEAKAMKGVLEVFEIEPAAEAHSCGGVAVVAETTYIALQARNKLKIEWNEGPAANESSETLRKEFRRVVDSSMKVVINQGDFDAAITQAPAERRSPAITNCRSRRTPPWSR